MYKNPNNNPYIQDLQYELNEFERMITEEGYDQSVAGFDDKYIYIKHEIANLYNDIDSDENFIIQFFEKRFAIITESLNICDSESGLDYFFPDRIKGINDEDLDDGFSSDKFFGLE